VTRVDRSGSSDFLMREIQSIYGIEDHKAIFERAEEAEL